MSELRWNALIREWTITATDRQERTYLPPRDFCPLCPTRPGGAPTEIPREDFEIAVFENRFPSFLAMPPEPAVGGTELSPVKLAEGASEVVVYSAQHDASLGGSSVEHIERLITVWAHRTLELGARPEIDYVFIFENRGEAIGVTLHHPHGQIYGYPFIPPIPAREGAAAQTHHERHGACLWCDLADEERADGRRTVLETPGWRAGVPFAARWPYEVHLSPSRHIGWLHELEADERSGLALALRTLLEKYDALFGFPLPYVMAIHQRPTDGGDHHDHLHFEFYPPHRTGTKLKYLAGSEAGAGAFINDTLPEETAAHLRSVGPTPREAVG